MTKLKLLGSAAAAILFAAVAMPVSAQDAEDTYVQLAPNNYVYSYGRAGFGPGDYYVGRRMSDDDADAYYYGDRPMTRVTTCGLGAGATYMGPDGRWYPC